MIILLTAIQDHIQGKLKTIFADNPEVKIDKFKNDVLGLLYKNDLFIRFNKLTENFKTRTKITESHKKYLNQAPDIPGLPPVATIVFAGYIPDKTMSVIRSINVVCWGANDLEWVYNYTSESGTEQTGLGLVPHNPEIPVIIVGKTMSKSRVSKKFNKRKTKEN